MNPWAYVLAASLLANGVLGWVYLGKRDAATLAAEQRDDARGLASACSDATEALREQADKRAAAARPRQAAAQAAAAARDDRALEILTTPAAIPGDDYASARHRVDGWLRTRALP